MTVQKAARLQHPSSSELQNNPIRDPRPSDPYHGQDDLFARREHRASILKEKHHLRYLPGAIPDHVREDDRQIPVHDGNLIRVRVYTPTSRGTQQSLIVMYHEHRWSMGDSMDEAGNYRLFSRDLGAICVNVECRVTPEHPYPTWINDSRDALQWYGNSAGGNIAAVLAHLARDEQLEPPLTGQYLCV